MSRKVVVLIFVSLIFNSLMGADCSFVLSGRVIDEHDKQHLDFASVFVKELARGVVTDSLGYYRIEGLCEGEYTLQVSHIGCETSVLKVSVKGSLYKDLFLEHHAKELEQIYVTAHKAEEKPTQTLNAISGITLQQTRGGALGDALKLISGVTAIQTGPSVVKPVIHGLHSNRVLILNNGVRQEGQQWGSEHAPEIDPFIADQLVVVKGANGVRYGSDAIAGVILVNPKPLRDSIGVGGELNLVGFSNGQQGVASAIIEQNLKRIPSISWRLQGTYKRAGNAFTPNYFLKNTGYQEYNFSYALGLRKENYGVEVFYSQFNSIVGIFSGSHIGNTSDLQLAFARSEPLEKADFTYDIERPSQHIEHELFKAKAFLRLGDVAKLNLLYARQYNLRFEYDKHLPRNNYLASLNLPELSFEIVTHTADLFVEHTMWKRLTGTWGVSGMAQENQYEGRYFIPNFKNYSAGVFFIERWHRNGLDLEAGVRYDQKHLQIYKWENNVIISPQFNFASPSGTVGAIYKFNEQLVLNTNVGLAWRSPAANELFSDGVHHGAAAVEIGNRSLLPERAYNFIATLSFKNKALNVELTAYNNYINNFIYLSPAPFPTLTIRGAFPTFNYMQVNALLQGGDFMFTYNVGAYLELAFKSAIVRAKNLQTNEYLVSMPADRGELTLKYLFKEMRLFKDSYISATVMHVAKQWMVDPQIDFVPPPSSYTLVGMEGSSTLSFGKQNIVVCLGVSNLFNTVYRDYLDRFRYYADAVGRNINVKVKIPFNYSPKK